MKNTPISENNYIYNSYLLKRNSYLFNGNNSANNISSVNRAFDVSPYYSSSAKFGLYGNSRNTSKPMPDTVREFISNAKVGAFDLKAALDKLSGNNKEKVSSFDYRSAESSNNDVLTIKSVSSAQTANDSSFTVEVFQLAASQRNTGNSLTADGFARDTGFETGSQSFTLNVEDKAYTINFDVSLTDTNRDVQQKIADSINSKNTDVKASVLYDSKKNTSELILESKVTGAEKAESLDVKFTVSNLFKSGLDLLGLDNISQYAQNAMYSVNGGVPLTSPTNDVNVGSGIIAVLKSEGMATATIIKDRDSAIEDVREMARNYNKILEAAEKNRDDDRTNALRRQLLAIVDSSKRELSRVGIEVASNGSLRINENKLREAADNGALERFVASDKSKSNGFINRLSDIADKTDKNTLGYATLSSSSFVANDFRVSDFNNNNDFYLNSRQVNRFAKYENTGILLNMML